MAFSVIKKVKKMKCITYKHQYSEMIIKKSAWEHDSIQKDKTIVWSKEHKEKYETRLKNIQIVTLKGNTSIFFLAI